MKFGVSKGKNESLNILTVLFLRWKLKLLTLLKYILGFDLTIQYSFYSLEYFLVYYFRQFFLSSFSAFSKVINY
jgi:hypothetical protein